MLARATQSKSPPLQQRLETLRADKRGSVGMIFALALTGIIMFLACAIDYARAFHARTKVVIAVDATTLFAAKELKGTNVAIGTLQAQARVFFDANLIGTSRLLTIDSFAVSLTPDGKGVVVNAAAHIDTSFARIAGINTVNIPATATAVFDSLDIEVAMQLDVTGSMNDTINGVRKIDSLKASTKTLLDILLPNGGSGTTKVRVGFAPFAAGVNAGSYAQTVSGTAAPGNCVYERRIPSADGTDDAPTGAETLLNQNDLGASSNACPSSAVVTPMTTNKASLVSAVNGFVAGGSTAGHLGTSWAYYLLSPNWSSIWPAASTPAPYKDGKTLKFAILETDGIYNTVKDIDLGDYSSTASDSQARAVATCTAMKASGIVIYSVGFIKVGDDPSAANTLIACASNPANFYKVQDGAQLDAAFQNIAQDISRLRLSK